MTNTPAALLLLALSGCVSSKVTSIHYKGLNIRVAIAAPERVDRHCRKYIKKNDKGEPITGRINACTLHKANGPFIWLAEDKLDRLPHELCHAAGESPSVCDGVHPERFH